MSDHDEIYGRRPASERRPAGVTIHFGDGTPDFAVCDTAASDRGPDLSLIPPIQRAVAVARLRAAADFLENS